MTLRQQCLPDSSSLEPKTSLSGILVTQIVMHKEPAIKD